MVDTCNLDLKQKISEHDTSITEMRVYLKQMLETQTKIQQAMDSISKSTQKTELLFEKLINLEEKTDTRFSSVEDNVKKIEEKSEELDLVRLLVKRPYITIVIGVGLYVLAIKEARDAIFG